MAHEPNPIKIVAWLLVAKKLIKFANDDISYKVSDNVMAKSNFDKFPLSKGDRVEVGIQEGVVTFLRKQKSESKGTGSEEAYEPTAEEEKPKAPAPAPKVAEPEVKKEEPTTSAPQGPGSRELTVFAVAANKKVVKFLEVKDDGWYQIAEDIQKQDYATIGLIAKSKVMVLLTGNSVVSCARIASEPAEQPKTVTSSHANAKVEPTAASAAQAPVQAPKKEWKPYNSNESDSRQKSIECQACINSACAITGQVASAITRVLGISKNNEGSDVTNAPTANQINRMIRAIAEENYKLLQELKSK